MKNLVIVIALVACAAYIVVHAAPPSYSLSFHFIPALVSARCSFASVWTPTNMTCAMCFCLNGRISRCVPEPGCNPLNATTISPVSSTIAPDANVTPGQQSSVDANPSTSAVLQGSTSAQPPLPVSGATTPAAATTARPGRHAKFVKTFRKR